MLKIVAIGPSQHGKTVFIHQLMLFIENLPKIASGSYHQYEDGLTQIWIRGIRETMDVGILPGPTVMREQPEALKIKIGNLGTQEEIELELRDFSGQYFTEAHPLVNLHNRAKMDVN